MFGNICLNLAKFLVKIYCKYSKKNVMCVRFCTKECLEQMKYDASLPSDNDIEDSPELWEDVDLGL